MKVMFKFAFKRLLTSIFFWFGIFIFITQTLAFLFAENPIVILSGMGFVYVLSGILDRCRVSFHKQSCTLPLKRKDMLAVENIMSIGATVFLMLISVIGAVVRIIFYPEAISASISYLLICMLSYCCLSIFSLFSSTLRFAKFTGKNVVIFIAILLGWLFFCMVSFSDTLINLWWLPIPLGGLAIAGITAVVMIYIKCYKNDLNREYLAKE